MDRFTVFVDNDSVSRPRDYSENYKCKDIELNANTIRINQGETEYATVFLENNSDVDFLIDYASIFDSCSELKAEENGYEKRVPAFGSSYLNVKIEAYDYAKVGEYLAFVDVGGHFQSEKSCHLFGGLSTIDVEIEKSYDTPITTYV